jgi:guanine deaminase
MQTEDSYISQSISEASRSIDNNGGPFGAIIIFQNEVIAVGTNTVTNDIDPTAHAEINAIRKAAKILKRFDLSGCILYSSCEPCPMCLSAIYWSHIDKVYYAATREDAHDAGFDDNIIYNEFVTPIEKRKIPFINISRTEALTVFKKWNSKKDKTAY